MSGLRSFSLAFCLLASYMVSAKEVVVGNFSETGLAGWQVQEFKGFTDYRLVIDDGVQVVKADSNQSASGMIYEKRISLREMPILSWRWRAQKILKGVNEINREGDDYPARVYVIVSDGPFWWQKKALVYVWSSHQVIGSVWENAFTNSSMMMALQSGEQNIGQWMMQKRNVYKDLKATFGREFEYIEALAIMTDTDNSAQSTTAYYGNIRFSSQ